MMNPLLANANTAKAAEEVAEKTDQAKGGLDELLSPETLQSLQDQAVDFGLKILGALVTLWIGFMIARAIAGMVRRQSSRDKADETVVHFLARLVEIALKAFVIIAALSQLGVKTASFVAIVGAAGLAVGLALQGSLSNFASGVMLVLFRPFRVGDFVDAGGIAGVVDEISIFTTELHTPDNKKIILPNASVFGSAITNFSALETRRIDFTFGIGYGDDIGKAFEVLHALMEKDERVLKDPAPTVGVVAHGASSVDLAVRPWVKSADYWDVYFDLMRAVKEAFDANNLSIPYPQQDVHLHGLEALTDKKKKKKDKED